MSIASEPLFAADVRHVNGYRLYIDREGMIACTTFPGRTKCAVCGMTAIKYKDDNGTIICSACGIFPPEELIRAV